jgi:hypothetical protein
MAPEGAGPHFVWEMPMHGPPMGTKWHVIDYGVGFHKKRRIIKMYKLEPGEEDLKISVLAKMYPCPLDYREGDE